MRVELERLCTAALAFANELRERSGLEPVSRLAVGRPVDCAGCPVAETVGAAEPHRDGWRNGWVIAGATAMMYGPRGGVRDAVPIPADVHEFMAAFDSYALPDLIAVEAVAA